MIRFARLLCMIVLTQPVMAARPVFLPAAPPVAKAPADYTAAEVLGLVSTADLPAGHPFAKSWNGLGTSWPGAAVAANIDALVAIALTAPAAAVPPHTPVDQDEAAAMSDLEGMWQDVRWILRHVMTVDAKAKAEALVRTVAAQTDPVKRRHAAGFAAGMFSELLDLRLLALDKDALDDATVVSVLREEEGPTIRFTARGNARRALVGTVTELLKIQVDTKPFFAGKEEEGCGVLKKWLTIHWSEIDQAAKALAAVANREIPPDMGVVTWAADGGKPGEKADWVEGLPPEERVMAREPFKATDDGILMYGRFSFESEGERYAVMEGHSYVVPNGAVLTAMKRTYSIGYYEGDIEVESGGKIEKLTKVYFVLTGKGIEFHYPSADGKSNGARITGTVRF